MDGRDTQIERFDCAEAGSHMNILSSSSTGSYSKRAIILPVQSRCSGFHFKRVSGNVLLFYLPFEMSFQGEYKLINRYLSGRELQRSGTKAQGLSSSYEALASLMEVKLF